MSRVLALTLVGSLLAAPLAAQNTPVDFIATTAANNRAEVELAKIARTRARHDSVKAFASRLVTDHMKASGELRALAAARGATRTAEPANDNAAALALASAENFDRTYIAQMVDAHRAAVASFEAQAKNAQDAEVQAFAQKHLPMIRGHLEEALRIQGIISSR
jgi:putative membrane protein